MKATQLKCYHAVSKELGKLLAKADESVLREISEYVLSCLEDLAKFPVTVQLIRESILSPTSVSQTKIWEAKESIFEAANNGDTGFNLEIEDTLTDLCWIYSAAESELIKTDGLMYQIGRLDKTTKEMLLSYCLSKLKASDLMGPR